MESSEKKPYGMITAKHRLHQPTWKTPLLYGRIKPCRVPNVERHSPWCVSKNTWAVANTIDINTSYNQYVLPSQYHQDTKAL